jgi:ComF family protein
MGPGLARHPAGHVRRLRQVLGRAGRATLDLVYPPTCAGCGGSVGEAHGLCGPCWRGVALIERPFCERLGTPFAVDMGAALLSPAAMADPPVFERARAVAHYEGLARDLVHRLKFGDRLDLAALMARLMVRAGAELLAEADLIVPVPLHHVRLWRRRFNQAAVLAREIGRLAGKPVSVDVLHRARSARPQVGLTRAQRRDNLQGVFAVGAGARPELAERRILLVDDVLTTGATGNAAARVLLRGGAAAVDVLVFARVARLG